VAGVAAVRSDALVGRTLDGRYQVRALLASGGMAAVYEALDTRLDRLVAVKVMHPALAEDPEFVARFGREARAAAGVSHPHVVAVYDQGRDPATGAVFLVMELVRGRTLRDLLVERGRLSPAEALSILEPVAAGLAAAHERGLVHRDVKPENVLLGSGAGGRVLVADFGLARAVEASPLTATTGLLLGTVAYLAPEQVAGGGADARSDVYAAGVLLFEMLAGSVPYSGQTPLAVAYQHVHSEVPAPGAGPAVDALVLAATARDPAQRPSDGGSLLRRVRAARAGVGGPPTVAIPLQARATERLTPTPPPRRRVRTRLLLALVVLLLAAAGSGTAWWLAEGRWTRAPGLLGLDRTRAEQMAERSDTRVRLAAAVFSDTVPPGRVVSQEPAAGSRVVRGSALALHLSRGPDLLAVPALAPGTAPAAVGSALRAAGLALGPTVGEYDDRIAQGTLLRTDPPAGTQLRRGAMVRLVVSRGPAPVPVPDLTGMTQDRAVAALAAARLAPQLVPVFDDRVPAGRVVGQGTPPGAQAQPGSPVVVRVSRGPELIAVPDVRGDAADDATRTLQGLGFVVRQVGLPGGLGTVVVTQDVRGDKLRRGSTVTIFVL